MFKKLDAVQDVLWFLVIILIVGTCLVLALPFMLPIWGIKWLVDKARGLA